MPAPAWEKSAPASFSYESVAAEIAKYICLLYTSANGHEGDTENEKLQAAYLDRRSAPELNLLRVAVVVAAAAASAAATAKSANQKGAPSIKSTEHRAQHIEQHINGPK
ncbi:hypothetical protein TYRP_015656 [Tyrophagus putrescentiae]|nr:hypothetical protein TYRP_015656 [Tyrophagus putrescentiae]